MKEKGNYFVEVFRLHLDKVADADVIAAINAMPYGSKSRIVTQAIRVFCKANGEDVEVVAPAAPIAPPKKVAAVPAPKAQPVVVEIDSF